MCAGFLWPSNFSLRSVGCNADTASHMITNIDH